MVSPFLLVFLGYISTLSQNVFATLSSTRKLGVRSASRTTLTSYLYPPCRFAQHLLAQNALVVAIRALDGRTSWRAVQSVGRYSGLWTLLCVPFLLGSFDMLCWMAQPSCILPALSMPAKTNKGLCPLPLCRFAQHVLAKNARVVTPRALDVSCRGCMIPTFLRCFP